MQKYFDKRFLTIDEAADFLGFKTKKSLQNLISKIIKQNNGRLPSFVVDAGGQMPRRIDREELVKWLCSKPKRTGRPVTRRL